MNYAIFVVVIMFLVLVHELGHLVVAKWCGMRVERFSIFFGRPLVSFQRGETEYAIGWLPLGGFVKITGMTRDEDLEPEVADRAYYAQSTGKKIATILAGPAVNLVVAFAVFVVLGWLGPGSVIDRVDRVNDGTPAAAMGLRAGDRVLAVDGERPIVNPDDLLARLGERAGEPTALTFERAGATRTVSVTPIEGAGAAALGVRLVDRTVPVLLSTQIASVTPGSPAAAAGIEAGDLLLGVAGMTVDAESPTPAPSAAPLVARIAAGAGTSTAIRIGRDGETIDLNITPREGAGDGQRALGVELTELNEPRLATSEVAAVSAGSPAAVAGLRPGDQLVSADGVEGFLDLRPLQYAIYGAVGSEVAVRVARDGRNLTLTGRPGAVRTADERAVGQLGFQFGVERERRNLVDATVFGWDFTTFIIKENGKLLGDVFTSSEARGEVNSIVGIGAAFNEFAEDGFERILQLTAVISLALAIFNLLPVLPLDGGHVVFAIIERLRGKPLPRAAYERTAFVGFTLIMLVFVFALNNDINKITGDGFRPEP